MLRADFAKGMKKQMYKYFFEGEAYADYVPVWPQVLSKEKSTAAFEQGTSVIGVGELEEVQEGLDAPVENIREGWTTIGKNRSFKKRIIITREAQDDHQQIEKMLQAAARRWGQKWPETKDTLAAKAYLNGGLTAGHSIFNNAISGVVTDPSGSLVYDNKPFFNLSNNARNSKAGGGGYYNGVTLPLTVANFKTVWDLMTVTNAKNERNEDVVIEPDILIVGKGSLEWTARTILESTLIPGSSVNDKNVLQGIVKLVVWRKINDIDFWCLSKAKHGKCVQERMEPEIDFFEDKRSKNWEAVIMARAGVRIDNWRFDAASLFATS